MNGIPCTCGGVFPSQVALMAHQNRTPHCVECGKILIRWHEKEDKICEACSKKGWS